MKKLLLFFTLLCTTAQTHTMMNGLRHAAQTTTRVLRNPQTTQQQIKRMNSSHNNKYSYNEPLPPLKFKTVAPLGICIILGFFAAKQVNYDSNPKKLIAEYKEMRRESIEYKKNRIQASNATKDNLLKHNQVKKSPKKISDVVKEILLADLVRELLTCWI